MDINKGYFKIADEMLEGKLEEEHPVLMSELNITAQIIEKTGGRLRSRQVIGIIVYNYLMKQAISK